MASLVCGVAWQLQAEKRCVYVAGADNKWSNPTTEYQEDWNNVRIWETAEGSNVYEGILAAPEGQNHLWIRFITKLADNYNDGICWRENIVGPVPHGNIYEPTLESKSGVYYTSELNIKEFYTTEAELGCWYIELPQGTEEVKYHLDLNKKEMWVVSDKAIMPVFNSDAKPTTAEAIKMAGLYRNNNDDPEYFIPKGECSFRIYNAFIDLFGCPSSDTSIAGKSKSKGLQFNYDNDNSNKWTITDWEGGTIKFNETSSIRIYNTTESSSLPSVDNMDYLVVVTPDDNFKIDRNNFSYVVDKFPHLTMTSDGVYEGTVESGKAVKFLKKVGATPAENVYITPGESNRRLSFRRDVAYSSMTEGGDNTGYWNGIVKATSVKVDTKASGSMAVQFGEENNEASSIYVVGTNSDWTTPSVVNYDFYQDHRIFSTIDGMYYGSIEAKKDANGAVSFRFFTDLKGWTDEVSLGSHPMDFYEMPSEVGNDYTLYNKGLGNFCFYNYDEDRIYILLDLANRTVSFHSSPLPGKELGPERDYSTISFISENNILTHSYVTNSNFTHTSDKDKLVLHSRILPFSTEEAEWMGSYLLEPADPQSKLELNEAGIARLALKAKDGVSTTPGKSISLASLPKRDYNANFAANNSELVITDRSQYYLVGEISGNIPVTIENAPKLVDYKYNMKFGKVIYIPAGKFDFKFGSFEVPNPNPQIKEVEWTDGMYNFYDNDISDFKYFRYVDSDWQGGWVLINGMLMVDLEKVNLKATSVTDYTDYELNKKEGSEPIYTGRVKIRNNDNGKAQICFGVNNDEYGYTLCGAPMYQLWAYDYTTNSYADINEGNDKAYFEGKKVTVPVEITGVPYKFPDVKECTAEVTLNLKDMTMTLEAVKMDELQKFSIFSDDEEVNGSEAVESGAEDNVMTASVDVPQKEEDIAVNFVTADNEVIMPAYDTEVTFDEHGNYSTYYATKATGSSTRRKAASEAHHWIIPAEYTGSELVFRIDHNYRKLSIAAAKAIKHYYVTDGFYNLNNNNYSSVFKLPELSDYALKETSEGIYEGDVKLPTSKLMNIMGGKVKDGKIITLVGARYNNYTIDMKSADDEVVMLAPYEYWVSPWGIVGDQNNGTHHLLLDMNQYKLTIKKDLTNVEETFALDGMLIEGLKGMLRITSDSDTEVAVYNMQGTLVKFISAQAGVTEITLSAGIYIAAGKKVMVR